MNWLRCLFFEDRLQLGYMVIGCSLFCYGHPYGQGMRIIL